MDIVKQPSTFAAMVDRLRYKSEEELKKLYALFFNDELKEEWKDITSSANFKDVSEEDVVKAIQKKRYSKKDV